MKAALLVFAGLAAAPAAAETVQAFDLAPMQQREILSDLAARGVDPERNRITMTGGLSSGAGASGLVFCGDIFSVSGEEPDRIYAGYFRDGGVGAAMIAPADDPRSPAALMCDLVRPGG